MADIQEVNIALPIHQADALKSAVEAGEYATPSDVVSEALEQWQSTRQLMTADVDRLRRLWDEGKASGPAGPVDFSQLREEARRRLKEASERIA